MTAHSAPLALLDPRQLRAQTNRAVILGIVPLAQL